MTLGVLQRRGAPRRYLAFVPPTYGNLRSLSRRGTIYRDAARHVATNARHRMRIPRHPVGLPPVGIYGLYHGVPRRAPNHRIAL